MRKYTIVIVDGSTIYKTKIYPEDIEILSDGTAIFRTDKGAHIVRPTEKQLKQIAKMKKIVLTKQLLTFTISNF